MGRAADSGEIAGQVEVGAAEGPPGRRPRPPQQEGQNLPALLDGWRRRGFMGRWWWWWYDNHS